MSSRVDASECRSNIYNSSDDLFSILEASRQIGTALTPPNSLKRTAFPSITGMAASGSDVAESKHGASVGNDSNCVGFDCIFVCGFRIFSDNFAWLRNTRCVSDRKIFASLDVGLLRWFQVCRSIFGASVRCFFI